MSFHLIVLAPELLVVAARQLPGLIIIGFSTRLRAFQSTRTPLGRGRGTSLCDARIPGNVGQLGMAGGQVSGSEAESRAAGVVSKPRPTPST
jgi:hypothetical protein